MSTDSEAIITPSDYSKDSENTNSIPCGVCRRQFSRYTCPQCNLLYCSLQCFRSTSHAECSEAFYRKEVENDIHTTPSKTTEERQKMMELLKRFEEDAANDEAALLDEDADNDEDDLTSQFQSMDLDNVSYEEIWSTLTQAQRDKFLRALDDPTSELAQQLLASEELEKQVEEPWWERSSGISGEAGESHMPNGRRYGDKPQMMTIPPSALTASSGTASNGPSLLYNIFATLMAYAYVTRYLSKSPISSISQGEPEYQEARRLFSTLVPFLTDRKSKTVLPSLSGVITDLWSRFEPGIMTPSFFAVLMRDAEKLLRPSSVTPISSAPDNSDSFVDHLNATTLLALSDISVLFQSQKQSASNAVTAKLAFYAAKIIATPAYILTALANEAVTRAKLVEREEGLNKMPSSLERADANGVLASKPNIEVLP